MTNRERILRAALKRSMVALDDWLHVYAAEQCDDERVKETLGRLGERGTIAYIADVQAQNRKALARGLPTAKQMRGILK